MDIKAIRKYFKLSQKALGESTDIPMGRINGWEQQGTQPKKEDYDKLENFFVEKFNAIPDPKIYNDKKVKEIGHSIGFQFTGDDGFGPLSDEFFNHISLIEKEYKTNDEAISAAVWNTNDFIFEIRFGLRGLHKATIRQLMLIYPITARQKSIRKPKTIDNDKKPKGMPVYEAAPATLSNIESYRDEHIDTDNPDYWLSIPQYRKCNYATRAKGDSMYPLIKNNAIVGGREINDIKVILFGEIYIVHTTNGIETVKYIHPHEGDKDMVDLVPANSSARITPIHKSEIQRLYLAEFTINPL